MFCNIRLTRRNLKKKKTFLVFLDEYLKSIFRNDFRCFELFFRKKKRALDIFARQTFVQTFL